MELKMDVGKSPENKRMMGERILKFVKSNLLVVFLLLALVLGVGLGAAIRTLDPPMSKRGIMYLRFPGDILMNMLSFLIVPLVISSLISGLSSLDTRASGKMGLRAMVYYLTTTFAAVVLGIILSVSIEPGTRGADVNTPSSGAEDRVVNTADTFLDLIRQCFPDNIVAMCFSKTVTEQVLMNTKITNSTSISVVTFATITDNVNITTVNPEADIEKVYDPVLSKVEGMNVLGMVVFSIFFGVVLGRMGERGRPLINVFESLCDATMQLVKLVIWYSPLGILCLISSKVVEMDDPGTVFQQLVFYFFTVMLGLGIHGLLVLPLIYFLFVRKNPFTYLHGVLEAMVTALATASSSATMPVTMRCLEEKNGVDSRIVKFVIPVGATINMDGTALYEAVAVLFIGQMRGFQMDIGRIITISVTATAAAIGAAGVPQAGLVTMVIVLSSVGFPAEDVALILAVDWLLDRFRTAINVLGDAFGAGIVHHLSRSDLDILDKANIAAVASTSSDNDRYIVRVDSEHTEKNTYGAARSSLSLSSALTRSDTNRNDSHLSEAAEYDDIRERHSLLNEKSKFKNYEGTRNNGFDEDETNM